MKKEVWKDIPGYEGYYQASNTGRVKALERWVKHPRGPNGMCLRKEKILAIDQTNSDGYCRVCLHKGGKAKVITTHRLVALAFLPKEKGKRHVNHKNRVRNDNRLENLEWVTRTENNSHRYGDKPCHSKYTGVTLCSKTKKKWIAHITIDGVYTIIGRFDTEEDAFNAYMEQVQKSNISNRYIYTNKTKNANLL